MTAYVSLFVISMSNNGQVLGQIVIVLYYIAVGVLSFTERYIVHFLSVYIWMIMAWTLAVTCIGGDYLFQLLSPTQTHADSIETTPIIKRVRLFNMADYLRAAYIVGSVVFAMAHTWIFTHYDTRAYDNPSTGVKNTHLHALWLQCHGWFVITCIPMHTMLLSVVSNYNLNRDTAD